MGIKLTEHFTKAELACHDGNPVPDKYIENAIKICQRAEKLRALMGALRVNCGYRTVSHNKAVGGAPKSQHLTASALDLHSYTHTAQELAAAYEQLIASGDVPDGGLGVYPKSNFIHIDLGRPRRWQG
jgi:uncharacterized protein YcbK (DUF882 family)